MTALDRAWRPVLAVALLSGAIAILVSSQSLAEPISRLGMLMFALAILGAAIGTPWRRGVAGAVIVPVTIASVMVGVCVILYLLFRLFLWWLP